MEWVDQPAPKGYTRTGAMPKLMPLGTMMAVVLAISLFASVRSSVKAPSANVREIAAELGRWKCPEGDYSDPALEDADSYLVRSYVRDDGARVQLLVVYRRYGRREFAHRPDQCFPAGGYIQLKKDETTLPWAGREDKAVHMLFDGSKVERGDGEKGVPVTTVSYFFVSGNRSESDFMRQQLIMATERLFPNKNGWTFVRLVSQRVTTDEAALEAQKDFMKTFEAEIRRVVTTDPETAGKEGA